MSDFQDYVQGLQMLGGVLALPRSAQYAQQSALAHRRMLEDTGMDPADIKAAYPDAPLQWLSPGEKPGIGGKILGGVGDVGALLSTIAGKPVGPPRMDIADVAQASKLRKSYKEQQLTEKLGADETDPTAKLLLQTGNLETYGRYKAALARGGAGGSYLSTLERLQRLRATNPNHPDIPILEDTIRKYDELHPGPQKPKTPAEEAELERQRVEIRNQIEADRREKIIRDNNLTGDDALYVRTNGTLPARPQPQRDQPFDFRRDIYPKVYEEHQARARQIAHDDGPDAPGARVDDAEVMRDALQRADAYRQQGVEISNMPKAPPPAPRETGIGMSHGETEIPAVPSETPTKTPTTTKPATTTTTQPPRPKAKGSAGLGGVQVRAPETQDEIDFLNQTNADMKSGKLPEHVGKARIIERFRVK